MAKAIILAAGQGTRLKHLTEDRPKCMISLFGKTILEHQLDTFSKNGINDVVIVTGYHSQMIENLGCNTILNNNYYKTNMVYSLFSAREYIRSVGNEDLIVSYGDIIFHENNLQKVIQSDGDVSIMIDVNWQKYWEIRMENPLDDAETLLLDSEKKIIELGKKPIDYSKIDGQYTGLFKVSGARLRDIINVYDGLDKNLLYDGNDYKNIYMTTFLQQLIDRGWDTVAVEVLNGWLEVDTVEDVLLYEKMYNDGTLSNYIEIS